METPISVILRSLVCKFGLFGCQAHPPSLGGSQSAVLAVLRRFESRFRYCLMVLDNSAGGGTPKEVVFHKKRYTGRRK